MTSPESHDVDPDMGLARRWSEGDRAAGDQLLRRYYPILRRFFSTRLDDADQCEDLIQDTLQALLEAAANFEGRSSFKTFMFVIARNKLFSYLRAHYRAAGKFDPVTDSVEDILGRSLSSLVRFRDSSQHMLRAMLQLPVQDQLLLELRYWNEMSGREIAEVFELSTDVIRARLFRARQKLAKNMSGVVAADDEGAVLAIERRLRQLGAEL